MEPVLCMFVALGLILLAHQTKKEKKKKGRRQEIGIGASSDTLHINIMKGVQSHRKSIQSNSVILL